MEAHKQSGTDTKLKILDLISFKFHDRKKFGKNHVEGLCIISSLILNFQIYLLTVFYNFFNFLFKFLNRPVLN